MKKILVIGGSKGIGKAIIASLIEKNNIINLSRTPPSLAHENLTHYNCGILTDELPQLDAVDADSKWIFLVGTFSFINRKRYKLVLQAEGGFRARVQFELCGLPTSN